MNRALALAFVSAIAVDPAAAASFIATGIHPGVVLVTGDTWIDRDVRFRLYGVQACLRGTYFTNSAGGRLDCGEASIAFLAAFAKDTNPQCKAVATTPDLTYVVCSATVGDQSVDLGTALISSGYAFASRRPDGLPTWPAYAVAEEQAMQTKSGLWQFPDIRHPSVMLGQAASRKRR